MPRNKKKAGQPNRPAQMHRAARRRAVNAEHKRVPKIAKEDK